LQEKNHIYEKCWEKFGCIEWAQLADADTSASGDTAHVHTSSGPPSDSSDFFNVVLSHEEYLTI